jgi:hypothetical protein
MLTTGARGVKPGTLLCLASLALPEKSLAANIQLRSYQPTAASVLKRVHL